MTRWTESVPIIVPDRQDPPDTEFYDFWATPYENLTIGMLWAFRTTSTRIYPQFTFSRDGIHYDRRFRQPVIPLGPEPTFDAVAVYAWQPVVHGERIFIYYGGVNWRAPEQLDRLGEEKAQGAVGLAVLPLDGFISLDGASSAQEYSEVTTRSFVFSGNQLRLNMEAGIPSQRNFCEVKVEILAPDYFPLAGYTFEDADPLGKTGRANLVSWNRKTDVSELAGRPVKLKFYFRHAKLYSFQFVE